MLESMDLFVQDDSRIATSSRYDCYIFQKILAVDGNTYLGLGLAVGSNEYLRPAVSS